MPTPRVVRANCFDWVPENIKSASIPLIITDPPYGDIVDEQWDIEWTYEDQWRMTRLIEDILEPGGTAYVYGGIGKPHNRLFYQWLAQLEDHSSLTLWDHITWGKKRAYGTSHRYLFTREEIAMVVKGSKPKIFNVPLLDEKRGYAGYNPDYPAKSEFKRRTNVWTDVTELMRGKIHKCEKPVRLSEIMIETSSNPGDTVVDLFAGAGGVGVAAEKLGREAILIEKSNCEMRVVA